MWSLLHNPSAYPSARTHTSSVVGSCFTYKVGMLPVLRFQAELSPSFLWKFTEFRAKTPPMPLEFQTALPPPPPRLRNSSPRNPPLSLRIPRCRPWYGMDIFWNHPIFGYLRKLSENVRQGSCDLWTSFGESSEIFGKSSKTPSSVGLYNKKNITR